ncbi:DUF6538 domain-containing protein [Jiella pelagia]|uniref:Recombinase XerD n=1 Tax=Jiella pelagia TaxID=2986949 RepID=A0ABY7CAT2_9HYPH|nr:DUF6538 domain-containing protein [Jiella pelagia]WAP70895.1 recombinase XerD [Jiella pelagia]
MLNRLVSSVKRSGSSKQQFVQRIPADVRGRTAGLTTVVPVGSELVPLRFTEKTTTVRLSLRTSEPREAKMRLATVAAHFEALWNTLRQSRPVRLTHEQATALAGDLYRAWAKERPGERTLVVQYEWDGTSTIDNDGRMEEAEAWQSIAETIREAEAENDLGLIQKMLGPLVDRMLLSKGIRAVDGSSREVVLRAFVKALGDAFENRQRNAGGDYSPDPKAVRFPSSEILSEDADTAPIAATRPAAPSSLTGLVDAWWLEAAKAGRTISTFESYRNTMSRFVAFVKHDNARRVSAADVLAFKDFRLASGISPKTVGDSDIAGLRAVFGWAVVNGLLPSNPAESVRVMRIKARQTRTKALTEDEARALLRQSSAYCNTRESPKLVAAKRWVPWLQVSTTEQFQASWAE